jgi:hypothetical protein
MPTWGELLQELADLQRQAQAAAASGALPPDAASPHDILRRKYLKKLSERTGRATIVYATAWTENKENLSGAALSVGLVDVQGFMEAVSNVSEKNVDLFLHSPGGSAEAAEAVMHYLRTRFEHIRVVVPLAAMSAATMMALAADEIVMGAHSQLGPIDPQLTIRTPEGPRSAPGQAIIDQFEQAKRECQDPANIAAWMPILRGYGPGLLAICENQRNLAEEFATVSLETHMFAGDSDAHSKAEGAAKWFADFTSFRSHGRRVDRDAARGQNLKIVDLEADSELQDAMLSVHHAVSHTLAGTGAFKIIENHHGRAFIQQAKPEIVLQGPLPLQPAALPPGVTPQQLQDGDGPAGGNRAQRRAAQRKKR